MTLGGLYVPPSDLDPVTRALTYPYPAPPHDYVFRTDGVESVVALTDAHRRDRLPVLAIGSNRSPAQLQRKFADMPHAVVAVERVRLADLDVVYSAHLSGYGAVAATLLRSPGTRVEISITWLGPELMDRMHATEGIGTFYDFVELASLAGQRVDGTGFDRAFAYVCRLGALAIDGVARAVDAIGASNRRWPAIGQRQAQTAMMDKLGERNEVERFIAENVATPALRRARELRAAVDALPFEWPNLRRPD
ncbi:MAG: hypothetical protein FJX57_11725 [Alphaproteobacteria bacterium]|nr:hypothetical protein [Alphaproteobacteria bacterium]